MILIIIGLRYGLLAIINKKALSRAAKFPSLPQNHQIFFWLYQFSNWGMIISFVFYQIQWHPPLSYIGWMLTGLGFIGYALSIINFAKPNVQGINQTGLYRISRNPMYLAFYLYFLGGIFLLRAWWLLGLLAVSIVSTHFVILAEEEWCLKNFGEEYKIYTQTVPRYI